MSHDPSSGNAPIDEVRDELQTEGERDLLPRPTDQGGEAPCYAHLLDERY